MQASTYPLPYQITECLILDVFGRFVVTEQLRGEHLPFED
jgi:hypothetical protein